MITRLDASEEELLQGLRLTVEEYYSLGETQRRYELIDGVAVMSPGPTPRHQRVAHDILTQLQRFLDDHPLGEVLPEVDVHFGTGPSGGDLVYRPDAVYLPADRLPGSDHRIVGAPDMVLEVVSPESRQRDSITKKADYERCGVGEYWLIDPDRKTTEFWLNQDGHFVAMSADKDSFTSQVIPGFVLDLQRLRKRFEPW